MKIFFAIILGFILFALVLNIVCTVLDYIHAYKTKGKAEMKNLIKCDLSNFKTVFEMPLKEQLTDSYYKSLCFSKVSDCINNCKNCIYIDKCGAGCRASALNNCGSYFGIDENACRFFKNGWYEKTLKFIEAL